MTTKPGCGCWKKNDWYDEGRRYTGTTYSFMGEGMQTWNPYWKYCPECGKKAEVVEKPLTPKQVADEVFDRIGKDFADQGALDE